MKYLLDTSAILFDPKALERLYCNDIIIPLCVIHELEGKRNNIDTGYAARNALRTIEEYRKIYSNLSDGINLDGGGFFKVDGSDFDSTKTVDDNIIDLATEYSEYTLLSNDLPMRLKASFRGVKVSAPVDVFQDNTLGDIEVLYVTSQCVDDVYEYGYICGVDTDVKDYPVNSCFILSAPNSSALVRKVDNGDLKLVSEKKIFGVSGKSAEQKFAIDILCDSDVSLVSLGGKAGTGKTTLAVAAGLEAVLEKKEFEKIVVFRPMYAVGGQDVGFLPGTIDEKVEPWRQAIFDCLDNICSQNVIDEVVDREILEIVPLTYIRGRTISNSYIIIEEAQNLDKMTLLTALSRTGQGSKVVITYDVAQRDNFRVGRFDGIASVVSSLSGSPLFGHVELFKTERSAVAELVTDLLD